jgi:hypothetical protein
MEKPLLKWGLFQIGPLPTWAVDRVLLIGDAAHAQLPWAGAGSGMALEDGIVLAYLLAQRSCRPDNIAAFLRVVDAVRRPRCNRVQQIAWDQGALARPAWIMDSIAQRRPGELYQLANDGATGPNDRDPKQGALLPWLPKPEGLRFRSVGATPRYTQLYHPVGRPPVRGCEARNGTASNTENSDVVKAFNMLKEEGIIPADEQIVL